MLPLLCWIFADIETNRIHRGFVADNMVVGLVLPKLARLVEPLIDFIRSKRLPRVENFNKRVLRVWFNQHMHVVRHDDVFVEFVTGPFKMVESAVYDPVILSVA